MSSLPTLTDTTGIEVEDTHDIFVKDEPAGMSVLQFAAEEQQVS